MIKLEKAIHTNDKGRLRISYEYEPSPETEEKFKLFSYMATEPFKKFLENSEFSHHLKFLIEILGFEYAFDKDLKISPVTEEKWLNIIELVIYHDFDQTAYVVDVILDFKKTNKICAQDIEFVFGFNSQVSTSLFTFTRWVERRIQTTLKLITDLEEIDLSNLTEGDLLKDRSHKNIMKSIKKYVNSGFCNNSQIISNLSFYEKIDLLKSVNASIKDKLFPFSSRFLSEEMTDKEVNKLWHRLLSILNDVGKFRNKICHNDFIIDKMDINDLGDLLDRLIKAGDLLCSYGVKMVKNLRRDLIFDRDISFQDLTIDKEHLYSYIKKIMKEDE